MKLTSVVLIATFAAAASTQVQAGERMENNPVAQACKTDIQQLCQGQKGQQAEQCLKNNQSKLSSQCKGALQGAQK